MANTSAFNPLSPPTSTDTYPSPSTGRPRRLLTPRPLSPPSSTSATRNRHRKRRSNPKQLPSRKKARFDLSSDLERERTRKKHMPSLRKSDDNTYLSTRHPRSKSERYISTGKVQMDDDASVPDGKDDTSDEDYFDESNLLYSPEVPKTSSAANRCPRASRYFL